MIILSISFLPVRREKGGEDRYKSINAAPGLHRPAQTSVLQTHETLQTKTNGEYFQRIWPSDIVSRVWTNQISPPSVISLNVPAIRWASMRVTWPSGAPESSSPRSRYPGLGTITLGTRRLTDWLSWPIIWALLQVSYHGSDGDRDLSHLLPRPASLWILRPKQVRLLKVRLAGGSE